METSTSIVFELLFMLVGAFFGAPVMPMGMEADAMIMNSPQERMAETVMVSGEFESVAGVMDPLSCVCDNGGYLTEEDGTSVPVCLGEDSEVQDSCRVATVEGVWLEDEGNVDMNNPCPTAGMSYVLAQHAVCEF